MVHISKLKEISEGMHYIFYDFMLFLVDDNNTIKGVIDKDCNYSNYEHLIGGYIMGDYINIEEFFYDNEDIAYNFKITGEVGRKCSIKGLIEDCYKSYVNGKLHGYFKSLFSEGEFYLGRKVGKWLYYNYTRPYCSIIDSKSVKECIKEFHYVDGKIHGKAVIKNHDCSIISRGEYVLNKKHGKWTFHIHGYKYNRYVLYDNGIPKQMIEIKKEKTLWEDDIKKDEVPYNRNEPSMIVWKTLTKDTEDDKKLIDFLEFSSRICSKYGRRIEDVKNKKINKSKQA